MFMDENQRDKKQGLALPKGLECEPCRSSRICHSNLLTSVTPSNQSVHGRSIMLPPLACMHQ